MEKRKTTGIGTTVLVIIGALFVVGTVAGGGAKNAAAEKEAETYRLVHAIGNDEHISATGLSKAECERRKSELKIVATSLGTYNEATGYGSITCLPDSLYD